MIRLASSRTEPSPQNSKRHKILYAVTGGLAALVLVVPLTGALADAVDAPSATITGTVFDDRDNDGRVDNNETGLTGVSVSDGLQTVITDKQGRYSFGTDTERRDVDLVFITQPAGYSVGTDDNMTPKFYRNLGALAPGDAREVNFGLRKDKASESGGFTFGNVADPHVNAQLPEQIDEINSTRQDLAFIQVSGDLTNNATDAEFEYYKASTAKSKVPVWPAVGNHEYSAGATYAARINNYRKHVGPEWYSFDYSDRHFLVLEDNGAAPFAEQLEWVKADLKQNVGKGKHLVVLTHQPMNVPFGSSSVYDEYGKVLEQYGAELILVGHEHSNDVEPKSDFAGTAKHIQTNSSSYTIDNSPRGFRFVNMNNKTFDNPFRMYGAEKDLTIVSPAPGTAVPLDKFPGIQVNAYDTTDAPVKAQYRIDGKGGWRSLKSTGEFTWYSDLPGGTKIGKHTVEVQAFDKTGASWKGTSKFTLTNEKAIKPIAGTNWTQHHGDASHSGVAEDVISAGQRLAWSYRTEGTFLTGSPVIVNGVVYAGTRDENGDGNSALHAVSQTTGKKLWSFPVPSSVHGSIAVSDGLVFVPTLRGTLFAVDARTGKQVWRNDPGAAPEGFNQRTYGYYGVTVAEGKVLFPYQTRHGEASAGLLVALDVKTGKRIWASAMTGATMSDGTPAVSDGHVYVGNETADRVVSYNLQTGALEWRGTEALGGWQDGIPSAADGRVFIGSGNGIIARDGATGATLWSYRSSSPSLVNGNATPAAAAIRGNVVYMGFPSGEVAALNATTGALIWKRLLPGSQYRGGSFTSPALSGNTLFVGANSGSFYALDARSGQPLWQQNLGTWVSAGPAVSGNTVVVGAFDGNLYAFTPGGTSAKPWPAVTGKVTKKGTGEAVATAVTVVQNGTAIGSTSTDAAGNYRLALEKGAGTYTVQSAQLGYATAAKEITVDDNGVSDVNLEVSPVNVDASIGKRLPSGLVEGGPGDIVIENKHLAMAIAKVYDDPQLTQSTTGKVLDMAITGQPDQLDWINLPYVSTAEPLGGSSWQQLQTRSTDVQIVENTGEKAVVRVTGTSAEHPGLKIVTTYTATADEQFITAATTFSNDSAAALSVWAGDAMDHDGAGSRSAVAGYPVITGGGPFSQVPNAKRWIGQAGTGPDNQTYGLVYSEDSGAFTGYSQSNFTMSKFKLDLAAGAGHTITRKIVVASNGGATDKFAVLNAY